MDVMPEQFKQACWNSKVEGLNYGLKEDLLKWNFDLGLKKIYEPDATGIWNLKFDLRRLYCVLSITNFTIDHFILQHIIVLTIIINYVLFAFSMFHDFY